MAGTEERTNAITAALDIVDKDTDANTGEDAVENKVEETKVEEKKEESKAKVLSEDELIAQQGLELMRALRDPEKAPIVIKFLAENAGYTKAEVKAAITGKDSPEVADDITSYLKESLGPEFEFLADKIGKGVEKFLDKKLEMSQVDIRKQLEMQEAEKLKNRSAMTLEKITSEYFGKGEDLPEEVAKAMSSYMDRVNPSPDTDVKDYVEDAFNYAIGKTGARRINKGQEARVSKNRIDAASRLNGASERVTSEENIRRDSKPMTRLEAIRFAVEQAEKS